MGTATTIRIESGDCGAAVRVRDAQKMGHPPNRAIAGKRFGSLGFHEFGPTNILGKYLDTINSPMAVSME
jgi:hypothetical protein